MNDRTGQQIGSYRLTWLLGRGGFAEVYLAEHVLLKTMVAIKLLLPQAAENNELFLEEARTVAHLVHPHIVRLLHFDIDPKTNLPYLVMDYAPNGSLRQRHPKGTKLPLLTIINYVSQVASALQYAHDSRIIHLDIKPENMLLNAQNNILLSDFGLATIAHSSASMKTREEAGTIHYMAPEQIRGKPRPASDQYALAVTVYQWLSGAYPFIGNTTIDIAMQHMNDLPPSVRNASPDVTPAVEQVLFKALAKDPQQRYSSILAFAVALEQASLYEMRPPFHPSKPLTPLSQALDPRSASLVPNPHTPIPQPLQPSLPLSTEAEYAVTEQPTSPIFAVQKPPSSSLQSWQVNSSNGQPGAVKVSRRTAVFAGVGAGAAVIGGGLIWFFASDHTVQIWNADGSGQPFTYQGHNSYVYAVAWSPDGKQIASGSLYKTVQVWNVNGGGQSFIYHGHNSSILSLAWSPDGTRIASGSGDKTVQIWNADGSGQPFIYKGHSDVIQSVAWSPDGTRIASASADKTVQVWNVNGSGQPFVYNGHSKGVWAVAWSPNGKNIVSGSLDKTAQVWSADGSGQPFIYKGHGDSVVAIAWSPDGTRIASGSIDKTVQLWGAG